MFQRYAYDIPGGFEGAPLLYMATLFSLFLVNLLALEWFWRVIWGMKEHPCPLNHPITIFRLMLVLIGVSIILRSFPDTIRLAFWHQLTPAGRLDMIRLGHWMRIVSVFPWSLAWLIGYLAMPMMHYQLNKQPLPVHLWPTRQQIMRPVKIGMAVLFISAAITVWG